MAIATTTTRSGTLAAAPGAASASLAPIGGRPTRFGSQAFFLDFLLREEFNVAVTYRGRKEKVSWITFSFIQILETHSSKKLIN
jgi:hypothetical protein